MGVDDALDIVVLILILALMTPIMITQAIPLLAGEVGGFGVQIEKAALHTEGEIIPQARQLTSDDVMLMLAIQDEYCPLPKALKINVDTVNGPTINIDSSFLTDKTEELGIAYAAMSTGLCNVKTQMYVGASGMREWVITK